MTDASQIKTEKSPTKEPSKGKKRDRSESERKLLKAAETVFSKQGFKGATTRLIARKADVNESLIGRYFDGKMGLLIAIIERYITEEDPHGTLNYPPQENLADELMCFAKYKYHNDTKKNFDFFKIVLSQAIVDAKFCKRIRETVPIHHQPQFEERLRLLQKQGKIRPEVEIPELIKEIGIFLFGTVISERLILGASEAETLKSINNFIRRYAMAVEA